MLNELRDLERGLAAHGIATVARHPDLSTLSKGDLIRVRLGDSGAITDIELLSGRERPEVWTLRDGKHNGFPGVKISRGLLAADEASRAAHGETWRLAKTAADKRAAIVRLTEGFQLAPELASWPKQGYRDRLAERLADLRRLEADAYTSAVPATFERFLRSVATEPPFLARLVEAMSRKVSTGEEPWLDPIHKLLTEPGSLAMDVARDRALFRRNAGDPRQIGPVSAALQSPADGEKRIRPLIECALSGPSEHLLKGSFPQPTLPSIGISFLFSRNHDIPAMARYGRNGPQSLPIDADLAARLSGALATVTESDRYKRTWRRLPAEVGDKQDLLIAFVAAEDELVRGLADDEDEPEMETETEDSVSGEAKLEKAAAAFLKIYDGIAERRQLDDQARILVLRAVDPANRKAMVDRRPRVSALHEAARAWANAMRNAPAWIRWHVFVEKKAVLVGPSLRRPLSLIALSRRLYIRGGREVTEVSGLSASDALALFLAEGDRQRRARKALKILVDRHASLLSGLAHANRRGQARDFDPKLNLRQAGLHSIAWIGALLHFMNRPQETYMDDTGFKLGQFLAAVDAVHMGYCADVRGGQIPPALIGNAVFTTAGRDPIRALDVLAARWKPYAAWAGRPNAVWVRKSDGKDGGLDWAIRRGLSQARLASELCADLQQRSEAMREPPDERFRAELLLGYVAGTKPEPKAQPASPVTIDQSEGGAKP